MSTAEVTTPQRARTGMLLRVLGALALGYSGWLHLDIALERPGLFADGQVTLSGLFIARAVPGHLRAVLVREEEPRRGVGRPGVRDRADRAGHASPPAARRRLSAS